MAQFKFEGAVDGISERQLDFIKEVLKEHGFDNEVVTIEAVGKPGDNYSANVKRFIVNKEGEAFKMIVKIAPTNEMLRAMANVSFLFLNEHVMYQEVLPRFTELEESEDIPQKDRLKYAKCYGTIIEQPHEVIILEDLKETDFVMLDRFLSFTDVEMKLALNSLAKLHALSYVFKNRDPNGYEQVAGKLLDGFLILKDQPFFADFFRQMEDSVGAILEGETEKRLVKGSMLALKSFKPDVSKFTVIKQGDAWTNNIMFKVKDEKAVECCMIDYQQSCQSNPVTDLYYCIFNCTDYANRAKHYHEWIDYYHSELDKYLSNFGLKSNYIYPKDQLDADLKRYAKICFALALVMAGTATRESSEAASFGEALDKGIDAETMKELTSNLNVHSMMRLKEKVEGLIASFIELGYLK